MPTLPVTTHAPDGEDDAFDFDRQVREMGGDDLSELDELLDQDLVAVGRS